MLYQSRVYIFPILILLQSCVNIGDATVLVSPSSDFCIPNSDFLDRVKAAESGDVVEMKRLYWHYLGCESNREIAFYWGRRAADLCDLEMQDEVEQWLHSYRDKSIEVIIPLMKSSWGRSCH